MPIFEYKVIPAPQKGKRARGAKGPSGRFANALETVMNEMGVDGWEYQRTDTLPAEERSGLTGKVTVFQNMLVFRRERVDAEALELKRLEETKLLEKAETSLIAAPAAGAAATETAQEAVDSALAQRDIPAELSVEMPDWGDIEEIEAPKEDVSAALRTRAQQVGNPDVAAE